METPDPQPIPLASKAVRLQAKANRSTRDHWTWFASHRAQIHALLVPELRPPTGRLCVLGAGNCNDVDLAGLAGVFEAVHLVDIDAAALTAAAARQGVATPGRIVLHGGVDLTGIAARFSAWEGARPSDADVAAAARDAAAGPMPNVGGPFDVVLSPCLLSQLVGYASDLLGPAHPRRRELLLALRARHLRMMVDLLAPGGTGILVCDVASSDGVPALRVARRLDLPGLLDRIAYTGRHFDGLAPQAVESALRSDPLVAPLLGDVQRIPPWLWHLGPRRTFLVYALRVRRSSGAILLG